MTDGNAVALERDLAHARMSLDLLADAGNVLGGALDGARMFDDLAQLCARTIADWCGIYVREHGVVRIAAVGHTDPRRRLTASELTRRYPIRSSDPIAHIIASGRSVLRPQLDPAELNLSLHDEQHGRSVAELDIQGAIVAPFSLLGGSAGALLLLRGSEGEPFDERDRRIAEILAKRLALAYDNVLQYRRVQRAVDTFQRAALPKALPKMQGLVLDAFYGAAEDDVAVGGDWYDAFPHPDGRLVITIGDVAGKGFDAAVLMATVRQSIRVAALQRLEPSAILEAADAALELDYPDRYVTAFVGLVDPRTWTIAYSSAGHPAPLIRRPDGTLLALSSSGLPLGASFGLPRRTRSIAGIPSGSLLVLYTDGLIEATHDVLDGDQRLRDALSLDAVLHAAAPATLIRELVVPDGARDDIAILTLALGRETHWSFESQDALAAQSARSSFVSALSRESAPDSDLHAAEVIFGELVGNVVRYAPGPIDIDLEWTNAAPILHVLDRGRGFDLRSTLPADPMSERGRGLYIVSALGKGLRADRLPGFGSHVRVGLPVRRREV